MDSGGSTSYKPFAKQLPTDDVNNDDDMDIPFSAQFIEVSLKQLKDRLANVEHKSKSSLVYAQQTTTFINDDHLTGFLYAENFDIDVSSEFNCCVAVLYCNVLSHSYDFLSSIFCNMNFFFYQLALTRLLRYWKDRHDLFGDKYIQPLTLYGMCLCSELCLFYVDTHSKKLCISYVLLMLFSFIRSYE